MSATTTGTLRRVVTVGGFLIIRSPSLEPTRRPPYRTAGTPSDSPSYRPGQPAPLSTPCGIGRGALPGAPSSRKAASAGGCRWTAFHLVEVLAHPLQDGSHRFVPGP